MRKQSERSREGSEGLKHFPLAGGLEDEGDKKYTEKESIVMGPSALANRMNKAQVQESFVRVQGYHHLRNCVSVGGVSK